MLPPTFARRVAIAIVAVLIATPGGTASAHAPDRTGVKRLWSVFPLGPQIHIPRANESRHRATRPPANSASTKTRAASPPVGVDKAAGSRGVPRWLWPLIVVAALALGSAAVWLLRRGRGSGEALGEPTMREGPLTPPRPADPIEAGVATPQETHPWTSGRPRNLETLPRRELFEMADAIGFEDAVLMSREELIEALRPSGPAAGTPPAAASDLELARYAAAYAAACRSGNPAPMLAVSAIAASTTEDPAEYSKRLIAEARRRGLLTSYGGGEPGGELTGQSKILLRKWAREHPQSTRR